MGRSNMVDADELRQLWMDETISRREIGIRLGVSQSFLSNAAARLGLPRRETVHCAANDPTPEQIAERARECRERHYAARRLESEEASRCRAWHHELTRLP